MFITSGCLSAGERGSANACWLVGEHCLGDDNNNNSNDNNDNNNTDNDNDTNNDNDNDNNDRGDDNNNDINCY